MYTIGITRGLFCCGNFGRGRFEYRTYQPDVQCDKIIECWKSDGNVTAFERILMKESRIEAKQLHLVMLSVTADIIRTDPRNLLCDI